MKPVTILIIGSLLAAVFGKKKTPAPAEGENLSTEPENSKTGVAPGTNTTANTSLVAEGKPVVTVTPGTNPKLIISPGTANVPNVTVSTGNNPTLTIPGNTGTFVATPGAGVNVRAANPANLQHNNGKYLLQMGVPQNVVLQMTAQEMADLTKYLRSYYNTSIDVSRLDPNLYNRLVLISRQYGVYSKEFAQPFK